MTDVLIRPPVTSTPDALDRPRRVNELTSDDVLNLTGSLVSSLLLTWVLYERILHTAGALGFAVVWLAVFLAIYTVVLSQSLPRPLVIDRVVTVFLWVGAGLVGLVLASALIYTFVKGHAALFHWNFFTHDLSGPKGQKGYTSASPYDKGGILQAIVGTCIEVGIAILVSLPLGVGTAVFMTEVPGRLADLVRTVVTAMTALPSIVAGLFILSTLIVGLGLPKSGIAAAAALTVMMLPIIARSADVVLRVVPDGLREAGVALGSSTWKVVWHVVLPTARGGLATALILGVARGIGETSPVLLTTGDSSFLHTNPFTGLMNSLPLRTFFAVRSPDSHSVSRGFATASVLLGLVLVLFIVTRLITRNQKGRT